MKKFFILLLTTSVFFLASCSKDEFISVNAVVEKNCKGSFLKIDDRYFYVCNSEKVASYSTGQNLNITYRVVEGCQSRQQNNCDVSFTEAGIIEVDEVKTN
jgi:hypothetical protein